MADDWQPAADDWQPAAGEATPTPATTTTTKGTASPAGKPLPFGDLQPMPGGQPTGHVANEDDPAHVGRELVTESAPGVGKGVLHGLADVGVGTFDLLRDLLRERTGRRTDPIGQTETWRGAERYAAQPSAGGAEAIGRFAGSTLPFLAMPGASASLPARLLTRGALPAMMQPLPPDLSPAERGRAQALQGGVGMLLGLPFEAASSLANAALTARATRQAEQKAADATARQNRMNKTLYDFARRVHADQVGERSEAIDELTRQHETQLQRLAADYEAEKQRVADTKEFQKDIPHQTALSWYRRTLDAIGMGDRAPSVVSRESGAQVQQIIGDELNRIRGQMSMDDPATLNRFNTAATAVSNRTLRALPAPYRAAWQDTFRRYVVAPFNTTGPMTGPKLARWIAGMNDEAESLARRANIAPQPDRAPLEAQRDALRRIATGAESLMTEGNPQLAQELLNAKRAYFLWARGQAGSDALGAMDPAKVAGQWSSMLGGRGANYQKQMADPTNRNADAMRWLDTQIRLMREPVPPAERGPRPPAPGHVGGTPLPPEPTKPDPFQFPQKPVPPVTPESRHPMAGRGGVGHSLVGHYLGLPGVAMSIAHALTPPSVRGKIAEPAFKAVRGAARTAGPPVSAAGGEAVSAYETKRNRRRHQRDQQQRSVPAP